MNKVENMTLEQLWGSFRVKVLEGQFQSDQQERSIRSTFMAGAIMGVLEMYRRIKADDAEGVLELTNDAEDMIPTIGVKDGDLSQN